MSELIEKVIKIAQGIYIQGGEKRTHELAQEIIDLVEQSQWIKVSDRLPESDIGYLVFVEVVDVLNGGSMYIKQIAVYSTIDKEWLIDGVVTQWQPLPSAPD